MWSREGGLEVGGGSDNEFRSHGQVCSHVYPDHIEVWGVARSSTTPSRGIVPRPPAAAGDLPGRVVSTSGLPGGKFFSGSYNLPGRKFFSRGRRPCHAETEHHDHVLRGQPVRRARRKSTGRRYDAFGGGRVPK